MIFMVYESLNRDNQIPANSANLSRSTATKMVHKRNRLVVVIILNLR